MTNQTNIVQIDQFPVAFKRVGDKYLLYLPLGGRLFMLIDSDTGKSKKVDEQEIANAVQDVVTHLGHMCKIVPVEETFSKVGHA